MTERGFTFAGRMAMSTGVATNEGIADILLRNIPGAVDAVRATTDEDRQGTDWWVECIGHVQRRRVSVDVKARSEDYLRKSGKDDLALETWSVLNETPGWTRDPRKRTDYILWFWQDTGRWCLLPFAMLCAVFSELWETWKARYQTAVQTTYRQHSASAGWQSECVYVPRKVVWRAIYDRFGGEPKAGAA
jgi:hypothetical protein